MMTNEVLLRLYELSNIDTKIKMHNCTWGYWLRLPIRPMVTLHTTETSIHWNNNVQVYYRSSISAPVLQWETDKFSFKLYLFKSVTLLRIKKHANNITQNHLIPENFN
jgi:hypothetical protein